MMEVWKNSRKFGDKAVEITIPSTGDDWELYTSTKSCSAAARKLTGALKRALRNFDTNVGTDGPLKAARKAFNVWWQVAVFNAAYGSADSEPRYVARNFIAEYANKRGFNVYGGDIG